MLAVALLQEAGYEVEVAYDGPRERSHARSARWSTSASGDGWLGARRPPAREPAARRAAPGRRGGGLGGVRRPAREAPGSRRHLARARAPGRRRRRHAVLMRAWPSIQRQRSVEER